MSRPTLSARQQWSYVAVAAMALGLSLAGVPYVGMLTTPLALWALIAREVTP